ncbi:BTAD domain-containing putative transcriptional regulator [Streptomyces sp. NPDC091287]|uniref:AfsR/SARP family transcriptional regulator n=1 Tax=Streptomyces sp. NPDC091287 TaxID=3365988 RepID=UPI0038175054
MRGSELRLGGPRQRTVFAVLALNASRVVPLGQLIDTVWGESPPATARSQIQICVSALRRILADHDGAGLIRTLPAGYRLAIDEQQVDVHVFTTLLAQARDLAERGELRSAVDAVESALQLWSGPALMGLPSDLVQRHAYALEERRLTAQEDLAAHLLGLGLHQQAVSPLHELVESQPLREKAIGYLMVALYRSGRQSDALTTYRRARAHFIDELGIEPGQELKDLESAVLNGSLTPAGPRPDGPDDAPAGRAEAPRPAEAVTVPRQLPSDLADFTGRGQLLADITGHLGPHGPGEAPGSVRMAGVTGMGGVGKSSLAVRAAHQLTEAYPDGQLYLDFHDRPADASSAWALGWLLRALGVPSEALPDTQAERVTLYRSHMAGRRILLVLDGITGPEVLQLLTPGSHTCAVLATSRQRLTGVPGLYSVEVDVLDEDESLALLCAIAGRERVTDELPAAIELAQICAGLPLALRIAGARIAMRSHWRIGRLVNRLRVEAARLDEFSHGGQELRSTIAMAYNGLGLEARHLFRLLSLSEARDFAHWVAAALLDTDCATAEDLLDELVDAQLLTVVVPTRDTPARYGFHGLIRLYAKEQLEQSEALLRRRAAVERLLGAWMRLAESAHRAEYGGDYTILHSAAERWALPPDTVAELLRQPAAWWESERTSLIAAIRLARAEGLDDLCWDLALTSVTLFEAGSYYDDWLETATLALDATDRTGNRRGQGAMHYTIGTLHMLQKRLPEAEERFGRARELFEAVGERHGQLLVLRNVAFVDRVRGDLDRAAARYRIAAEGLREVGDKMGEAHVLSNLARTEIENGRSDEARRLLDRARGLCKETGCRRVEAQVLYRLGELHLEHGDTGEAGLAFRETLRLVQANRDQAGEAHAHFGLGRVSRADGRIGAARTDFTKALSVARLAHDGFMEAQALYALAGCAREQGRFAEAQRHLRTALGLFDEIGALDWQRRTWEALDAVAEAARETTATEPAAAHSSLFGGRPGAAIAPVSPSAYHSASVHPRSGRRR